MGVAVAGTEIKAAEKAKRQLKRSFCMVPPGGVRDGANEDEGMRTNR